MPSDLHSAHARLSSILGAGAEPIEVLERGESHRAFWRPEKPRVVLLAESHVYTRVAELSHALRPSSALPPEVPRGFVRLVYSLGYGENGFMDRGVTSPPNSGTPQYWKIFQSCVASPGTPVDYSAVQVSRNREPVARLRAKVGVLERLKERGIWLVDASVAALYLPGEAKPSARVREAVLQTSWDAYTRSVVESAGPEAILCIGVGVARALRGRLDRLGIPWGGVHQPQAHLSSDVHSAIHVLYGSVCNDPRRVKSIPSVV